MIYKELLDQLSKLTEEQLCQTVKTCGLDRAGAPIDGLWVVEEDQIDPSGEGMEPISVYTNPDNGEYTEEERAELLIEEEVVCSKGTILLLEDDSYHKRKGKFVGLDLGR